MGQNQAKNDVKDTKFELKVDEELDNDIKEEINPLNKYNSSLKKGTNLMKYSGKLKSKKQIKDNDTFNDSEDEESEKEENEICLSYITELVDTIYSNNINMQLKNRPNRTIYESMFDIRNVLNSEEDLNNDEYNIKSCQIMNEIIDPDISDIINNKKEEIKNNNKDNIKDDKKENEEIKVEEEEEKSESLENDFYKNWDYANDDIFINENDERNEIELNLDFYNNEKDKSKDKLKNNNKKVIENEKIRRSKTKENIIKKNPSIIKKNKSLILIEDIIKYNEKSDINEINNHINDNINKYINKIATINIKNKNNSDNNIKIDKKLINASEIENNNDNYKNFNNKNKENNNKENISINNNLPNENFEIINNDDLYNESFKKNINNISNNNNNYSDENSSEFILKDKRNISNYGKDDEDKNDLYINEMEKKIDKKLINLTIGNYAQKNNRYDSDSFNKNEIRLNSDININNNKQIINNINKNTNNTLLYKKRIININSKNNSKNNSNFNIKEKSFISKNDNNQKDIIDFNNISAIKKEDNLFSSNNTNFNINEINSPKRIRAKTPLIHIPKKKNIIKKNIIINNNKAINANEILKPITFNQSELSITKTENFDLIKDSKIYISKTPVKKMVKKAVIIPKSKVKINLLNDGYNKNRMNTEINNINKTIALVEKKIKSIERSDKKSKQRFNFNNNKYNNNINIKTIRNITPLVNSKKHIKKKKIRPQKTFDENYMKGYKDIMPKINKERIEPNNKVVFNNTLVLKRNKSTDILLKRKKVKKIDKTQKYQNINNYIFGKQKYLNDNND